jgi:hypothetical protein
MEVMILQSQVGAAAPASFPRLATIPVAALAAVRGLGAEWIEMRSALFSSARLFLETIPKVRKRKRRICSPA